MPPSYAKQGHIETFENETGYGAQFVTGQGGQGGRDEASLNEGWDEMQLRSRLMKYHPTPVTGQGGQGGRDEEV